MALGARHGLGRRRTLLRKQQRIAQRLLERLDPSLTPHEAQALLARFLIRGERADQPPSTMSGGERFRVGLARTLFADPAPQLLVLDEPTNNIDLASAEQLVAALDDYRGALLIVTHDEHLSRDLRVERTWNVTKRENSVVIADDLAR